MFRVLRSSRVVQHRVRNFGAAPPPRTGFPETSEWGVFPNEREGNVYDVNWSLTVDGITPIGDAYRNARVPLLTARLPVKVEGNKVELKGPLYTGDYKVTEAGDSISLDDFQEAFDKQVRHFESGIEMFVEDGGLGSHATSRTPGRLVTDNAAAALIARALMVYLSCKFDHLHNRIVFLLNHSPVSRFLFLLDRLITAQDMMGGILMSDGSVQNLHFKIPLLSIYVKHPHQPRDKDQLSPCTEGPAVMWQSNLWRAIRK
jgi:hypothetical protein